MNGINARCRLALMAATAVVVASPVTATAMAADTASPDATAPTTAACPGADLVPTADNARRIAEATRCLANAERRARGLRPLVAQRQLTRSGATYARQMVRERFFDHVAPDGTSPVDRNRRAGYIPSRGSWLVGENIGWGSGSQATPRAMMDAWMASPGHRANLLRPQFRHLGVGVTIGAPTESVTAAGQAATYATEFGRRSAS